MLFLNLCILKKFKFIFEKTHPNLKQNIQKKNLLKKKIIYFFNFKNLNFFNICVEFYLLNKIYCLPKFVNFIKVLQEEI